MKRGMRKRFISDTMIPAVIGSNIASIVLLRRENENGSGDTNVGYLFNHLHRREYLQLDFVSAPHLFPMGVVLACT